MAKWITRDQMLAIPALEQSSPQVLARQPRVSVLMMTRNHAAFLRQAVESVASQNCTFPFELIIGEDLSGDATREVALDLQREYPDLVRILIAEKNVGITHNFLRLAVRARGEFIAFLEGDDYWTRYDKLERQVGLMDEHPEFAWCAARTSNRIQWLPPQPSYCIEDILRRYIVHTSTVLFRTSILNCYPTFPDRVCWESMLLGYLTEHGRCGFINEKMSYYRRHEGGLWNNADRQARVQMSRDCIDALNDYFLGRYRRELADREAWIYRMDLAPALNRTFYRHWLQSFGILRSGTRRMVGAVPLETLRLWAMLLVQPLTAALSVTRAHLQLRQRLHLLRRGLSTHLKLRNIIVPLVSLFRRSRPISAMTAVQIAIQETFGNQRDVFFVQIGSNDGAQGDPLRDFLVANPYWRGIFVEPVDFLFKKLRRLYSGESGRFIFENVAIGTDDGRKMFYWISSSAAREANIPIPHWCFQLGSFKKEVLQKNLGHELSAWLAPFILEAEVATLRLSSLFKRNQVSAINLLHIDAEGYDYQILSQLDFSRYRPSIIIFEHVHLSPVEKYSAMEFLNANGYFSLEYGRDTIALPVTT